MKRLFLATVAVWAGILICISPALAGGMQNTNGSASAASRSAAEARYTRAIEGRAQGILNVLDLKDPAKKARVHDAIIEQYRALRAWDATNDAKLKALKRQARSKDSEKAAAAKARIARVKATLKKLHNHYIAELSANLTPAQVEKVKDKMTYNTVEATYRAYCEIIPNLTASDKAKILELLKEAREEAMDAGSAKAKHAIFRQYKGKINNYLTAHGHDVGKAYKEWGERQREKRK